MTGHDRTGNAMKGNTKGTHREGNEMGGNAMTVKAREGMGNAWRGKACCQARAGKDMDGMGRKGMGNTMAMDGHEQKGREGQGKERHVRNGAGKTRTDMPIHYRQRQDNTCNVIHGQGRTIQERHCAYMHGNDSNGKELNVSERTHTGMQ